MRSCWMIISKLITDAEVSGKWHLLPGKPVARILSTTDHLQLTHYHVILSTSYNKKKKKKISHIALLSSDHAYIPVINFSVKIVSSETLHCS